MKLTSTLLSALVGIATASPVADADAPLEHLEKRQSCPKVHVFGARETTVPQGYGTSKGLVDMVVQAYAGATSEAIVYPACGGQSNCGGASYESSASQGTAAVVKAVTAFNKKCPDTKIVLIGYSQGGQIMDNALCGGAGATLAGDALKAVKAGIFMGDPHNTAGLPYNVGTCTNHGVSCLASRGGVLEACYPNNVSASSLPVPAASSARRPTPTSSSRTAIRPTPTGMLMEGQWAAALPAS